MTATLVEIEHDGFVISTDPARVDVDAVYRLLREQSYWLDDRTIDIQRRAIAHSHLVIGAYAPSGAQVGFARMVTDLATYAWLCDVIVDAGCRGSGLGTTMVRAIVEHPDVVDVRWQFLATQDAHGLYRRFGYTPLEVPDRWMHRRGPT